MTNWSGITASLQSLIKPSILQPRLSVNSISQLDFIKFKQRGVSGVIIDKDNCITIPHQDELAPNNPQLHKAWNDLLNTFGSANVLIVSNSVGTIPKDPSLLGAESVSRNLRVPVLIHAQPKPSHSCVSQIATHFSQLLPSSSPTPSSSSQFVYSPLAFAAQSTNPTSFPTTTPNDPLRLLVIGDRLITDMILSTRLSQLSLPLPSHQSIFSRLFRRRTITTEGKRRIETIGILTTGLHEKEKIGTRFLRGIEKIMLKRLLKKRERSGIVSSRGGEKWEECLKDHQPRITQLPCPTPSLNPPNPRISTASSSPFTTRLISTLTSLSSLPQTLPHLIRRLPSTLLHSLKRSPHVLYTSLSRAFKKSANWVLERIPRFLDKVHGPMQRLVGVYTDPEGLAGVERKVGPKERRERVGVMERAVEGAEGFLERARMRAKGVTRGV